MAPHILGTRQDAAARSGRPITSEQTGLVPAALPGYPVAGPAPGDARRGHRVLRADRDCPDLPAAHGRHGQRALPGGLRHPGPPSRGQDPAGEQDWHRPAELPLRHLRRHHPAPVSRHPAAPWGRGGRADCHGGLQPADSAGNRPAAGLGRGRPGTAPVPAPHDLDQRRGPHPDPAAAFLRVPDQRPDPAAAERPGRLRAVAVRGPGQHVCWLPAGHRRAAVRPGQTGQSLVLVADHRHGRRGFLGRPHGAASRVRGVLELPHADRSG